MIEFENLDEVELKKNDEENEGRQKGLELRFHLEKAEGMVLSYIMTHGFTSRRDIAERCGQAGTIEISPRSVSRCLKVLTEKGFLCRVGNSYVPTERSRVESRQDTL